MTKIQIFESPEFGKVTTAVIDGKEHFAATECAQALGYTEPEKAIRTHCKGVSVLDTPTKGGIQKIKFISEGNLFRLIVRSNLPEAEKFEQWVFDEILPTIRRTGQFSVHSDQRHVSHLEQEVDILRQKLQVFEEHSPAKFFDYDESAALCAYYRKPPFGQEHLKRWLVARKILCKQAAKNEKPIQHYLDIGWFIAVIHEWYRKGKRHTANRYYITPKGLMGIIDLMIRDNMLHIPGTPQKVFPQIYPPEGRLTVADEPGNSVTIA